MVERGRGTRVFPVPQHMEEPVGHDHDRHPRQPQQPSEDHIGHPVMAQEDPAHAHCDDEDHTRRDQGDARNGALHLQAGEVHHEPDHHRGIERVAAGERRRVLVGRHGVRVVGAVPADQFLAQRGGRGGHGCGGADQDQRPPGPGGPDEPRREDAGQDRHADSAADVGEPCDEGVQPGAAELFHERQGWLVQIRQAGVVHHVVVDFGAEQRQEHHQHAAHEHRDPQGGVGHNPLAPAPHQPALSPGGHVRLLPPPCCTACLVFETIIEP